MKYRSKSRDYAFKILYQINYDNFSEETLEYTFNEFQEKNTDVKKFTLEIVNGVIKYKKELDDKIKKCLINWTFERTTIVNITLLRMGIFEIVFLKDINKSISISEILKLAKMYSDKNSNKFLNGILDKFKKTYDLKNCLGEYS